MHNVGIEGQVTSRDLLVNGGKIERESIGIAARLAHTGKIELSRITKLVVKDEFESCLFRFLADLLDLCSPSLAGGILCESGWLGRFCHYSGRH